MRTNVRVVIPDTIRSLVFVLQHRIQGTLFIGGRAEELGFLFVGAFVSEPPHDIALFSVSLLRQLQLVSVPLAVLAANPQLSERCLLNNLILDVKRAHFLLELVRCVSNISVLGPPSGIFHIGRILRAS